MSTLTNIDIVVVGGGLAGLVAAARAAELGLRTVVIEQGRGEDYACNSRYAGGIFHVSYHDPKLDTQSLESAMIDATGGHGDPALIRAIATDAGRSIDWLRAQGARFVRGTVSWHRWVSAPPRPLSTGLDWKGRGQDVMLRILASRIVERQGRILLGTRAKALKIRDGRCCGVIAEHEAGRMEIDAGAVVIADGGFQGNPALVRAHIGPRPDRLLQRGAGTGMGDGVTMAIEAGAIVTALDRFYGHVLSRDALRNDQLWPYPQIDAVAAAAIVVGADGRRLMDEGLGGIYIANELARLPDPCCATVILDSAIWEGPGREAYIPPNPLLEKTGGTLHRADTLSGLAAAAGLPADALAATVNGYNQAIKSGAIESLSPPRSATKTKAWAILRPPFLAIPICSGITNTMGGIAIDGHGRVKRNDSDIIDGLYAAGAATGGLEGGAHVGYVGGLIKASVFGLRAAEHAAQRHRAAVERGATH